MQPKPIRSALGPAALAAVFALVLVSAGAGGPAAAHTGPHDRAGALHPGIFVHGLGTADLSRVKVHTMGRQGSSRLKIHRMGARGPSRIKVHTLGARGPSRIKVHRFGTQGSSRIRIH
ncbi:MAG: hypothetical protein V3R88_11605 [Alphaproteobacteria bacterium]